MEKYDVNTKKAVGRGAFGSVYLYQRKEDRKEIIIKQITIEDMTTEERKGVMNEIELTRMFNHPNIVKYHDYFVEEKTFNIVMEYAPGGNLYDFLQKRHERGQILKEEEILKFFAQIARAMHHIHNHKILHRDMKTHNILLDQKQKVAKICDFGISKMLTKTNAATTVGTAHYMSPEVVEGKSYNKKSDIWSLGCILYELISLKRAFEGDTLSSILRKIIRLDYSKMPDFYSEELRGLVRSILISDPTKRPDLPHILASPVLINSLLDLETDVGRIPCIYGHYTAKSKKPTITNGTQNSSANSIDSAVYRTVSFTSWADEASREAAEQTSLAYYWGSGFNTPAILSAPSTDQFIKQVYCSRTKKLCLTTNGRVFSWESSFATTASITSTTSSKVDERQSVMTPKIIGEFSGSTIEQVCCGDRFVAVKTDRGMLMTWGSGEQGCLGHGTTNDSSKALVVQSLLGCTVVQISCGSSHMLALTNDQQVYAWGKGTAGNLGLNDRLDYLKPKVVPLPNNIRPKSIMCGPNFSFIIHLDGSVYACGNNRDNKLGILTDYDLHNGIPPADYLTFTKVMCKPLSAYKIVSIGTGPNHCAFITETGMLFTAGSNKYHQLGYPREAGDYRPAMVEIVSQDGVKFVGCGDTYTVAVTIGHKLFSWGTGQNGRLGLGHVEEAKLPKEIRTDGIKVNYQSLSVCYQSTLVAGQVKSQS